MARMAGHALGLWWHWVLGRRLLLLSLLLEVCLVVESGFGIHVVRLHAVVGHTARLAGR